MSPAEGLDELGGDWAGKSVSQRLGDTKLQLASLAGQQMQGDLMLPRLNRDTWDRDANLSERAD